MIGRWNPTSEAGLPAVTSAALRGEREEREKREEKMMRFGWVEPGNEETGFCGGPAVSDRSPDGDGLEGEELVEPGPRETV